MTRGFTLPRGRSTSYLDVSPIRAADLNAMQDCAAYGREGAYVWRSFAPFGHDHANTTTDYANGYVYASTSNGQAIVLLQLAEGLTITHIAARVAGTGAGGVISALLRRIDGDGTVTPVATVVIPAPVSADFATYSEELVPHIVTAAGESFVFIVTFSATNQKLSELRLRTYRAI